MTKSIRGLKTTPLTKLIGKTITLSDLSNETFSLIMAMEENGNAHIISVEEPEAIAEEKQKQITKQKELFVLERKGKDTLKQSTLERYDRAEEDIIHYPQLLSNIVALRNHKVSVKDIAQKKGIAVSTLGIMITVAKDREYIKVEGDRYVTTEKFRDLKIKATKVA